MVEPGVLGEGTEAAATFGADLALDVGHTEVDADARLESVAEVQDEVQAH